MCILADVTLYKRLEEIIRTGLNRELVNPASIDIRIGRYVKYEDNEEPWDLVEQGPYLLQPKEFVLVDTYEHIRVPHDLAIELKLKSSRAREGFDHSLAFWIDPGWDGVLTMEIQNACRLKSLQLHHGQRFGQLIVHKLDTTCANPYNGRYQNATHVEAAK